MSLLPAIVSIGLLLAAAPTNASSLVTIAGGGMKLPDVGVRAVDACISPYAVRLGADGSLYFPSYTYVPCLSVTNPSGDLLLRSDPDGVITWVAKNLPSYLDDIWLHPEGGVLFVSGPRIQRITADGAYAPYVGSGVRLEPWTYAEDPSIVGDGKDRFAAELRTPEGLAMDAQGNLYFADYTCQVVRKVEKATGRISLAAGQYFKPGYAGDGGKATDALLRAPWKLGLDADGNLLIVDRLNHCIRKVDRNGIITTLLGNPADPSVLREPGGVAVDRWGDIYITDGGNRRIRRLSRAGEVSTVAGGPGGGDEDHPTDALLGRFGEPCGIAVDPDGHLYIADYPAGKIKRLLFDPLVEGISRIRTARGDTLVLTGRYFGGKAASCAVSLDGRPLEISSWSAERVEALLPPGAAGARVVVRSRWGSSLPADLPPAP